MSSPMASLKRNKKSPLDRSFKPNTPQASSNVPYRYANDELLEEVTTRMITNKHGSRSTQGFVSDPSPDAPTDIDLMQTMISRIAILEKQIQLQNKQILDKDKRILVLEDKCRLYQQMHSEEDDSPSYVKDLEARCSLLQLQISDMEEFLLDYGMVWVGNSMEDDDYDDAGEATMTHTPGGLWDPGTSLARNNNSSTELDNNPYIIDFDRVIENIKELNQIAGEGEAKIEKTTSGARFKVPDPIQLILYRNGIVMFEGPFRCYDEESTRICMADITDGYFPSELQQKYPDGVPFKVIDKRDVTFNAPSNRRSFVGQGQSLGGDTQPSRLVPSVVNRTESKLTSGKSESRIPGTRLTADQFLSHIPSSVVRGGKVIDIRSSLSDVLKGSSIDDKVCPVTVVETQTMIEIKDRLEIDESVRPPSGKNITTLRIKDIDNHTYVLKMKFTDAISDVINYLNDLRKSKNTDYDLVTPFPSKVYSELNETLFDAGLTPNATMHIRQRKG